MCRSEVLAEHEYSNIYIYIYAKRQIEENRKENLRQRNDDDVRDYSMARTHTNTSPLGIFQALPRSLVHSLSLSLWIFPCNDNIISNCCGFRITSILSSLSLYRHFLLCAALYLQPCSRYLLSLYLSNFCTLKSCHHINFMRKVGLCFLWTMSVLSNSLKIVTWALRFSLGLHHSQISTEIKTNSFFPSSFVIDILSSLSFSTSMYVSVFFFSCFCKKK